MPLSLQELLGIKIPIIQAPMAGVQDKELAIAVSQTGALGSVPCAMLNSEQLHDELSAITASCNKPINYNFFCYEEPVTTTTQQQDWTNTLLPYLREFDIDPSKWTTSSSRKPFDNNKLQILKQFKPKIISFHFGLPDDAMVREIKSWGTTRILSSATTVQEALWLEKHGADIIIAQGSEAGGHQASFITPNTVEQIGIFSLLPQIVNAVSVPVIAAGGIADHIGIQAAKALGAAGTQHGTTYLLCHECQTTPLHRKALKSTNTAHTVLTNIFSGRLARGIVNRAIRELGNIHKDALPFPHTSILMNALKQAAESQNTSDFSPLWCGQNSSGCQEISAEELTLQLAGLKPKIS